MLINVNVADTPAVYEDHQQGQEDVFRINKFEMIIISPEDTVFEEADTEPEETATISYREDTDYNTEIPLPAFSEERYLSTIEERRELLIKQQKKGLTSVERRRLDLLNFRLHQLQMARDKNKLEELEKAVKSYENLAVKVSQLMELLKQMELPQRH